MVITFVPNPQKADYTDGSGGGSGSSNIDGFDGNPNGHVTASGPAIVLGKGSTEGEMWVKTTAGTSNNEWFKVLANGMSDLIQWTPSSVDLLGATGFLMLTDVPTVTSITFLHTSNSSGFMVKNTAASMTLSFPNLTSITSSTSTFDISSNSGITSISLPVLTSIAGTFDLANNTALTSFSFPSFVPRNTAYNLSGCALDLTSVNGILAVFAAPGNFIGILTLIGGTNAGPTGQGATDQANLLVGGALVTSNVLSLTFTQSDLPTGLTLTQQPLLATIAFTNLTTSEGGLSFQDLPSLTSLSLASLTTITDTGFGSDLAVGSGGGSPVSLTTLNVSSLIHVDGSLAVQSTSIASQTFGAFQSAGVGIYLNNNGSLTSLSFPALTSEGSTFSLGSNSALVSVSINATWNPSNNTQMDWSGCALNAATVNLILHRAVLNPTWGNAGETLDVSGGTSAAPSGAGIADKATLLGRGANVVTN